MNTVQQLKVRGPVRQARRAVREEEIAGARLGAKLRLVAIPVIMIAMLFWVPFDVLWLIEVCLLVMLGLGAAQIALLSSAWFRFWQVYLIVALEIGVAGFAMFGAQIALDPPWPPQVLLDSHPMTYFYFVLALTTLYFSPWLVLWAGAFSALVWSAGFWWVASLPESIVTIPQGITVEEEVALINHPDFVNVEVWSQDILVLAITTLALAVVVWRTRRLLKRQITVARERANLARHFPPNMVDELASHDQPLAEVRRQNIAVMFVDVVGFTSLSERLGAEATIALLRELHGRLEQTVFEHSGTLDKFLGDGVMATFGTPHPGEHDATHALEAGLAIAQFADDWNQVRNSMKQEPVVLSVGVHFGEVVLGDVGSARRLEYAVIGDTVNVASRLEELSRTLGATLVVSRELLDAAGSMPTGMIESGRQDLRGRKAPVEVCYLPREKVTS
ncbi:MAG: adenylate/guanylate cyclase domain-containing protein [Alphaproteobacteria bacterium]|jgi:adenylate cyclase